MNNYETIKLKDTVEMMESEDYKARFRAEYFQLKIRMFGLKNMLARYAEGVPFKPGCSIELLDRQLKAMELYASFLEDRAYVEKIDLTFIYE